MKQSVIACVAALSAASICWAGPLEDRIQKRAELRAKAALAEAQEAVDRQAAFEAALPARLSLVQKAASRFAPSFAGDPEFGKQRYQQFVLDLHNTPSRVIERALGADTLQDFMRVLSSPQPKGLGDQVNLVFVPRTPCRIADSRFSVQGPLTSGVVRTYANFSAPGQGANSGCNQSTGPGMESGTSGALALTVTVTGATAPGYLTLRPAGDTAVTSVINFVANQDLANSTVVRIGSGSFGNDFEILPVLNGSGFQRVDVVIDLLGFYLPAQPTALDCVDTAVTSGATGTNPSQETSISAPACTTGYTRVGMNCTEDADALLVDSSVSGGFCSFVPRTTTATPFTVGARCCRSAGSNAGRF